MRTEYAITVHGETKDQVAATMLIEACKHFRVDVWLIARLIHAMKPVATLKAQEKS